MRIDKKYSRVLDCCFRRRRRRYCRRWQQRQLCVYYFDVFFFFFLSFICDVRGCVFLVAFVWFVLLLPFSLLLLLLLLYLFSSSVYTHIVVVRTRLDSLQYTISIYISYIYFVLWEEAKQNGRIRRILSAQICLFIIVAKPLRYASHHFHSRMTGCEISQKSESRARKREREKADRPMYSQPTICHLMP